MIRASSDILPVEFRPRSNCGVAAVVDLKGRASHKNLSDALDALERMDHRGARGAEENTGDGAGVMVGIPDRFLRGRIAGLPQYGFYGVGQLFVSRSAGKRKRIFTLVDRLATDSGFKIIAWRRVPTQNRGLGQTAMNSEPDVYQLFLEHRDGINGRGLDRRLQILRYAVEHEIRAHRDLCRGFCICSLDSRRLVYKGMLTNAQLRQYYPDLGNVDLETPFALVHSRFSTNTLGSWELAHPYRTMVHNGEINTYRGNYNRLAAREPLLQHDEFGAVLQGFRPLVEFGQSDTALLDSALDLLMLGGRSLTHSLRMLMPEAWRNDPTLVGAHREWYDYHSTIMEPWDGPALVVATDGRQVAAVLDRNGFRPCRYDVMTDGRLILASEAGVLLPDPSQVAKRGRLGPGEMLLVDPDLGLVSNTEILDQLSAPHYGEWLRRERIRLIEWASSSIDDQPEVFPDLRERLRAAGYTLEHLDRFLRPMAEDGKDPIGAMGDDAPPAALSRVHRPVFDYFKQQFAQVSNPPIDYLRERIVTSLESHLGPQPNLLEETALHCRRVHLVSPILTNGKLAALTGGAEHKLECRSLDATFAPSDCMKEALGYLISAAEAAIDEGASILVVSDRKCGPDRLAIPSLIALGAVHQHLIQTGSRMRVGLVAEVADACTVHHMATLIGFGADAVNPYLALAYVNQSGPNSVERYQHALEDGLLKVMSKMGISEVESYKGSQLFEALGLASDVVECCFTGAITRIGGTDFARLEEERRRDHHAAYSADRFAADLPMPSGGFLYWRRDGEHHDWNPDSIGLLQAAVRNGDEQLYRLFSRSVNRPGDGPVSLRGMLDIVPCGPPVDINQVEPLGAITRRFFSGAMSLGALSPEAHETLAIGMNTVGGMAHSGEGGEQEDRLGTERECGNKQIASGRFGVTAAYLAGARQLEIKMAQGAKPGEGGQLPAHKVDPFIARLRKTVPGVELVSPPPHHDIYSIEDLAQLIHDLRCANPGAQIHVKLVSEAGVGTIAAAWSKRVRTAC